MVTIWTLICLMFKYSEVSVWNMSVVSDGWLYYSLS